MRRQRLKEELKRRAASDVLKILQNSAAASVAMGDWERLRYDPPLTKEIIKEFNRRMIATGNSLICTQDAINCLICTLLECPTYEHFAMAYPDTIRDACGPAYKYLYKVCNGQPLAL